MGTITFGETEPPRRHLGIIAMAMLCAAGCGGGKTAPKAGDASPGADTAAGAGGDDAPQSDANSGADALVVPEGGLSPDAADEVFARISDAIAADPRTAAGAPLDPEVYEAIAVDLSKLPGVTAADYAVDTLGTITIAVEGGGQFVWRHQQNDFEEAASLPEGVDLRGQHDPVYQPDFVGDEEDDREELPAGAPGKPSPDQNRWATRFPLAQNSLPDPNFGSDEQACPNGKIALIDFEWSYDTKKGRMRDPSNDEAQYLIEGVRLFERLRWMGEAAGFHVDEFHDDDITPANFKKLEDYDIVFTNGHGRRPGPRAGRRLPHIDVAWFTHEVLDPKKLIEGTSLTYHDAWKLGLIDATIPSRFILWRPRLFREAYKPSVKQLWLINQCWSMLPQMLAGDADGHGFKDFAKWWLNFSDTNEHFEPVDNFGHGLRDAGVHTVLGYITPATPEDIVINTMRFFRRLFGGYSNRDKPPEGFNFWPTCMSAQSFFRPKWDLFHPGAVNKYLFHGVNPTLWTIYTDPEPRWFRQECETNANVHATLQASMLSYGTPSIQAILCWEQDWSQNNWPTPIQDPICSQGDKPTTKEASHDAACAVTVARRVTNAILATP